MVDDQLALKVVPATFLLGCFVCLKESSYETRKNVFYFTSQGSEHSLVMKFGRFMYNYKMKFFIKKFYEKCGSETSSRESSVKRNLRGSAC